MVVLSLATSAVGLLGLAASAHALHKRRHASDAPSTTSNIMHLHHDASLSQTQPSTDPALKGASRHHASHIESALEALVGTADKGADVHSRSEGKGWLTRFFPSNEIIDQLFSREHMGNYVYVRATGQVIFEEMPLYVRLGMHLLFVDGNSLVSHQSAEHLLEVQSVRQGKIYDKIGPDVLPHIQAFVKAFKLDLSILLEPDLSKYPTFNSFFSRKLRADARPIAFPEDDRVLVSTADCRLTVWDSVDEATRIWIKGKQFSIPGLLGDNEPTGVGLANTLGERPSLAIFRLAPEDYHRFHSPVSGTLGAVTHIPGALYSVNPQIVNENLNVFTKNSRSVLPITLVDGSVVYVVAIGAMLVGSINWSEGVAAGKEVKKGDELGWFSYGGSTVIAVFPQGKVTFDEDLLIKSSASMEVLVRVGEKVGLLAA